MMSRQGKIGSLCRFLVATNCRSPVTSTKYVRKFIWTWRRSFTEMTRSKWSAGSCRAFPESSYVSSTLQQQCRCLSVSTAMHRKMKPRNELPDKKSKLPKVMSIWKNITVEELAKVVDRSEDDIFEAMLYIPAAENYDHSNMPIDDLEVIREIVKKLGYRSKLVPPPAPEIVKDKYADLDLKPRPIVEADLVSRPPVVTIMGHVDHGKTSLLDALRNTKVAESEAGGITQHIGAFVVKLNDRQISFLDTPGHAAFSALRSRGANVTDLVVLVVAADDGVMEQTRESLRMIREANAQMIIAINKIDKHNADVEKTKRMLLQEAIQLEEFGGDVQCVPISATKGTNLNQLVDAILVQTDLMNLRSEGKGPMEGVVIESKVDPGRGRLCTALVDRGVLRKSAILVAGTAWAKVRGMFDHTGNPLTKATPSTPVEVIGWRDLPPAGEKIYEVESEKLAHKIIEYRRSMEMTEKQKQDEEVIKTKMEEYNKEYKAMLSDKRKQGRYKIRRQGPRPKEIADDDSIRHNVIIKGDTDGSVEAILDVLDTYDCHSQCRMDVIHYGVGDIAESDVKLAEAFQACVYGFNVAIPEKLKPLCKELKVDYLLTNIIYRMVEAMVKDIEKKLPQKDVEEIVGEANVLAVFTITEGKKKIPVAGSRCVKGSLLKNSFFRLTRNNELLYDGPLYSLKHLKQEVETIRNGIECGLSLKDHTILPKEGDVITCYHFVKVPQKCEWDPGF
ncbi:unnamed protein product [Orchesella dallaii]|uniref:Translation initiation factor IF-2, mitochondrial n=1 Tax=Orchesella dallaii TaxID=48710 RepID=A0ABP1QXX7_9HEXA